VILLEVVVETEVLPVDHLLWLGELSELQDQHAQ